MTSGLKTLLKKILKHNHYRAAPPDDFIVRLRCSVIGEGMLHPGNVYLMEEAIQRMPDGGCVLEIGSYGGLSANLLTYLLKKHQRTAELYCGDAWVFEGLHDAKGQITPWIDGRDDVLRTDYMAYIKASFVRAAQVLHPGQLPHAIHLDSDAFFAAWSKAETLTDVFGRETRLGGPIAFAYIDGNHAYDFARRDMENAAKHLLPGGYLLLDDSASHLAFGSVRLAKEWRQRPDFELVLANPHCLFRKRGSGE